MIRFVDMTEVLERPACAFWTTITDRFLDGPNGQACESVEDVGTLARANGYEPERLLRFLSVDFFVFERT